MSLITRFFLFSVFAAQAAAVRLGSVDPQEGLMHSKPKPNIVVVVVDDLGWNDISHGDGEANIKTPNIDSLAEEGLQLKRHYAYNWCGPSRSSLMSGRTPTNVYYKHVDSLAINPDDPANGAAGPSTHMTLISEKMKEAGYKTAYTGKWGVGYATLAHMPLQRGYDRFFGYLNDANDYWTTTRSLKTATTPGLCEKNRYVIPDLWRNDAPARRLNGTFWEDYMFTDETLRVIEEHDVNDPLFLFHAFHAVHTPLDPPEKEQEKYSYIEDKTRRGYASLVSYADESIGKFVDALKEKDMWDNTIMMITSDNGGPIYGGLREVLFGGANNGILRGGKTSDWEGGIRVRSMLTGGYLPKVSRGRSLNKYVHFADWYATFCGLAGVSPHDSKGALAGVPPVDSINQWPLLSGQISYGLRKEMLISDKTYIYGPYKLITGNGGTISPKLPEFLADIMPAENIMKFDIHGVGYGLQALKNTIYSGRDCTAGCLFDIFEDPGEYTDLAETKPQIHKQMMVQLATLQQGMWNPDRGNASVTTCRDLSAAGYYGPFYPTIEF